MNKKTIQVPNDLERIFAKIDIAFRKEKIKLEYKYLYEIKGMSSINARQELANKIYKTWNGCKYMLSERSIQHIIYDLPLQSGEYYMENKK